jgi:hypothetical protein
VTPDFEDWLRSTEIPIEDTTDIETYRTYLEEELGIHGGSLDVATEVFRRDITQLSEHGIRGIQIEYPWGRDVRYGVQGLRGLFGWESIQRIREAEEW